MAQDVRDNPLVRVASNFLVWTAICGVSAAPSFIWGMAIAHDAEHVAAMLTGIGIFVLAYTAVSSLRAVETFKRRPFVGRTLKIGYGTRIALSILFPAGLTLDLWCGIAAVSITDLKHGAGNSFGLILATTLVQGVILNCILMVYMALIYGVQWVARKRPPRAGHCEQCGYDLRASKEVCPECGAVIPSPDIALRRGPEAQTSWAAATARR